MTSIDPTLHPMLAAMWIAVRTVMAQAPPTETSLCAYSSARFPHATILPFSLFGFCVATIFIGSTSRLASFLLSSANCSAVSLSTGPAVKVSTSFLNGSTQRSRFCFTSSIITVRVWETFSSSAAVSLLCCASAFPI